MRKFLFVLLLTLLAAFTGCRSDELPDAAASSASDSAKTISEASAMNTCPDESISSGIRHLQTPAILPPPHHPMRRKIRPPPVGRITPRLRLHKTSCTCGAKANGSAGTNQSAGERQRQFFLRICLVHPADNTAFGGKPYCTSDIRTA